MARDLAAGGWDVAVRAAPDAVAPNAVAWVLLADDAGRLLAPLAQAGGMGLPVLCLTAADAAMEGRLLRAGAHMVLPMDAAAGAALTTMTRLAAAAGRTVRVGDLRLCLDTRQAWLAGRLLSLRPLDFDLLLALATRWGRVVSAADLAAGLWPMTSDATDRLAAHIHTLRGALGPGMPVRGVGRRGYLLTGESPKGAEGR